MSAIELSRIWEAIEAVRSRISDVEASAAHRMSGIENNADSLREELRALSASVDSLTARLEEHMTANMKAYIDATLDVMKNDLRAFVRSLVPVGPHRP